MAFGEENGQFVQKIHRKKHYDNDPVFKLTTGGAAAPFGTDDYKLPIPPRLTAQVRTPPASTPFRKQASPSLEDLPRKVQEWYTAPVAWRKSSPAAGGLVYFGEEHIKREEEPRSSTPGQEERPPRQQLNLQELLLSPATPKSPDFEPSRLPPAGKRTPIDVPAEEKMRIMKTRGIYVPFATDDEN